MKRLTLSCLALAAAAAVFAPKAAQAASVTYDASLGSTLTDWADSVNITQFDPSLGTLNSVKVTIDGHVVGTIQFENRSASASTVTTKLQSLETVYLPDLTPADLSDNLSLVNVLPSTTEVDSVLAYDQNLDYGGDSGRTHTGLSADKSANATYTDATTKGYFTGTGLINLPVSAQGFSTASGSGNIATEFTNFASADIHVTYDYSPTQVPVPAAAPAGAALLGILGFRRFKKSR